MAEVALALARRHLDVEIAGGDLVGRVDQAADRRNEPVREAQAEPDADSSRMSEISAYMLAKATCTSIFRCDSAS